MLSKVNHGGRGGWIALLALAALSGPVATLAPRPAGAAEYVGAETPDVKAEDRAVVAHPQPVQVIFQFKTKGAPNARATKMIKSQVLDVIKASGDFSDSRRQRQLHAFLLVRRNRRSMERQPGHDRL